MEINWQPSPDGEKSNTNKLTIFFMKYFQCARVFSLICNLKKIYKHISLRSLAQTSNLINFYQNDQQLTSTNLPNHLKSYKTRIDYR